MGFLTFHDLYFIWDFYRAVVDELIFTTILGIVSVTALAAFFIPHWSAALVILPLISILYLDLLGMLQWAGVHINPVSYIALVLSIGLMVDFLMHILLCSTRPPAHATSALSTHFVRWARRCSLEASVHSLASSRFP